MAESFVESEEQTGRSIDNTSAVLLRITMPAESLYTQINCGFDYAQIPQTGNAASDFRQQF
jgi:hypothetical protein